ncbi:unnamed protein product [Rotaria sp. Silwood1]|nr:unnamed protein product [Rotaria sp. Silwood1]CAF3713851.1 unnamed protein product [Rotaria sp. Silwood1]CAF3725982.1 unnamed protein product [Rotaria sp. Silwood1]CAF4580215.1 unnamed protein product [Rotaria sp. Silwood1]CAF4587209.1 unnamed protein product [Rotaria sp. Silwood1]
MIETKSLINETSPVRHRSSTMFDDTDDLELKQRLEKFEREIVELKFENSFFETALERKKSESIISHTASTIPPVSSSQATTPTGSYQDLTNASTTNRGDRLARKQSKSRSTQSDLRIHLTFEQKLAIIMSELEQRKIDRIRRETINEKRLDQFESDVEWIDIEISDFELSIAEFLKTKNLSIDKRTHKVLGEKIDRYFHDHLQARESLINKLRDRSSGFKRQIVRLDAQLKEKEEMGETLTEVDFNQLKMENKQYLDKIDEKNIELVLLKQKVAKITKLLNYYKANLNTSTIDLIDIQQRINKQDTLYEFTQQEINKANYEKSRASKKNHNLSYQIENYQAPEILDYVKRKSLLCNLQRDCQVWKRKVELVSVRESN